MRKNDNKYGYSSFTEEELRKYLKLLVIPGVIILVILAVILAKNLAESKNGGTNTEAIQTEQPMPEDPSGSAEAAMENGESQDSQETNQETEAQVQNTDTFVKDGVPEINELMERYFAAKQGADIETVYQLFGRTDMEGAEELESEYRYTSRYTDGYENIVCYTKPGAAEGSYLVYVSYDLKFKHAETLAPGLFRAYVITNGEGSFQLVDSSLQDEAVLQQFEEAEKTDELILLRTEVYAKLRQALETDSDLAGVYGVLQKNPVIGETQETREGSSVSIVPVGETPGAAESAPSEPEMAQPESDSVPAESESVPSESESVPSESESTPSEADSAQAETEGVQIEIEGTQAE